MTSLAYPILTRANSKKAYDALKANQDASLQSFVSSKDNPNSFDEDQIDEALIELESLKSSNLGKNNEFDATASIVLDQKLELHPQISGDREFWLWLSIIKFRAIINWRFGSTEDQLAAGNNFGVGDFNRNYPWYLWTRVKVSKLEGDDPYRLTKTADIDYWKSHICAVAIGSSEFMPKEMTRWYVALPSSFTGVQKIDLVRALAREMNKLQATMAFECLSNDDIAKIVDEVGQTVIERGFE